MVNKRKVYMVSSGSYSDYAIVAVYDEDHKEQAENLARLLRDSMVEEWNLNEYTVFPPAGVVPFRVHRLDDGTVKAQEVFSPSLDTIEDATHPKVRRVEGHEPYGWPSSDRFWLEGGLKVTLYARDEDHALKIATDMFTAFLASENEVG